MIVRGLIVAVSGFLFIFAPGLPMGLLYQRFKSFSRSLLSWGIGVWLLSQLLANFTKSMIEPAFGESMDTLNSSDPIGYFVTLLGALMTSLFISWGMYIVLRRTFKGSEVSLFAGLTIGFGSGLVAQVFNGLNLVGSGFRLVFGGTTGPVLGTFAAAPFLDLIASLAALILFRATLLVLSGIMGLLVARAASGRRLYFWVAVLIGALFEWLVIVITLVGDSETPGQMIAGEVDLLTALLAIVYYVITFFFAYSWLSRRIDEQA